MKGERGISLIDYTFLEIALLYI